MISQSTRRNILTALKLEHVDWYGRLNDLDFLGRIFDLRRLPSADSRFDDAYGDIRQHRLNNDDWPDDWVYDDERFALVEGTDATFLQFLCETLHPLVRPEADEIQHLRMLYNDYLLTDGWEIVEDARTRQGVIFKAQEVSSDQRDRTATTQAAVRVPRSVRLEAEALSVSSDLPSWQEILDRYQKTNYARFDGILLGNGSSLAVWDKFSYKTLYEVAQSRSLEHHLSAADQRFFHEMGNTTNFEQVLYALWTADMVCKVLDADVPQIQQRYRSIQNALFDAVHNVHPPKRDEDRKVYHAIGTALCDYQWVFSTNYDLIVYWAMMVRGKECFRDFFWDGPFNPANTEVWHPANVTCVLYLHGGIHLVRSRSGETIKRVAPEFSNLIESLSDPQYADTVPLFVTEGRSSDKLASIRRSDYLSFAYQQFVRHNSSLVVFGNSLSQYDDHLLDAMRSWRPRTIIAIGMRPSSPNDVIKRKAEYRERLPQAQLLFFDSTTHPLGVPELKITENLGPDVEDDAYNFEDVPF